MGSQVQNMSAGAGGGQMLTFRLGGETYGVDILRVKEIRGWSAVTRIPHSPPHVLGVLNLRGAIVPIIDMRVRFALDSAEFSQTTVIIVLSLHTADGVRECGIVVDSVSDVVDVAQDSVKPPPQLNGTKQSDFINGIAMVDGAMLIMLNVDELVARDLKATTESQIAA
jgi:purine-binding chemotaxis protein CheW